jgi:hypothetical protein
LSMVAMSPRRAMAVLWPFWGSKLEIPIPLKELGWAFSQCTGLPSGCACAGSLSRALCLHKNPEDCGKSTGVLTHELVSVRPPEPGALRRIV